MLPAALSAQSVEEQLESLKSQISELEQRLDEEQLKQQKHEQRSEKWAKIVEKLPKLSGFAQFGYSWDDMNGGTSNFDIPHVRLSLSGDISKSFDYKLQFEFASPKLVDAYLRWKINPSFNVQMGQFHVPFSLEGVISPASLETIGSSMVVSEICGVPDTRDLGVSFYGKFLKHKERHLFEYAVGVFQGEGKNKADANKSKDVAARLKFFPVEELCLTGSYSYGELGAEYIINNRASAGIEWRSSSGVLRSEYFWHKQGKGDTAVKNDGFYVMASSNYGKFSPVLRYSYFNEADSIDHEEFLVGLTYAPLKFVHFQFNYAYCEMNDSSINKIGLLATFKF